MCSVLLIFVFLSVLFHISRGGLFHLLSSIYCSSRSVFLHPLGGRLFHPTIFFIFASKHLPQLLFISHLILLISQKWHFISTVFGRFSAIATIFIIILLWLPSYHLRLFVNNGNCYFVRNNFLLPPPLCVSLSLSPSSLSVAVSPATIILLCAVTHLFHSTKKFPIHILELSHDDFASVCKMCTVFVFTKDAIHTKSATNNKCAGEYSRSIL